MPVKTKTKTRFCIKYMSDLGYLTTYRSAWVEDADIQAIEASLNAKVGTLKGVITFEVEQEEIA